MIGNFFSTPIYMGHFSDRELFDIEIEQAISRATFANEWQPDNDTANTTFNYKTSTNIIEEFAMNNLNSGIISHAHEYLNGLGHPYLQGSVKIFTSWLNIFEKNQVIGLHEHGYQPNTFSGCYYHKTPTGSGLIQFKSTNPFVISFPHKAENYNNLVNVEPEEGMILLFPSWLMHKVLPNKTSEARISLAFNIEFNYTED